MKLQLYKDNQEILGSDGQLNIDGRFNIRSVVNAVKERNKRFEKNFPHKIANGFIILSGGHKINQGSKNQYKF